MKLTENFNLSEFASKDGAQFPEDVIVNIIDLSRNLQVVRDYIKKSININSGYRSPAHNKKVGGATNSQHLLGKASDITIDGLTPTMVKALLEKLISENKIKNGGVSLYPTFVHYDIRHNPTRW